MVDAKGVAVSVDPLTGVAVDPYLRTVLVKGTYEIRRVDGGGYMLTEWPSPRHRLARKCGYARGLFLTKVLAEEAAGLLIPAVGSPDGSRRLEALGSALPASSRKKRKVALRA